uniref:Uncharacterized protein n=1 Tax=Arundo donax TaxID=35708 RepID=A0A0A8XW98_ARUDO
MFDAFMPFSVVCIAATLLLDG